MQNLADTNIAVVGAGDFGLAIAQCFMKHKASVMLTGRDIQHVTDRAATLDIHAQVQPMLNTVVNADLVLLAVPDDEIETTCRTLTINFKKGCVVAHFSTELDSSALESARRKDGVSICSLYAMNIFPDLDDTVRVLNNRFHRTCLYSEGDKEALKLTNDVFGKIGFVPIEISREAKPMYHASAVMARDYLTILMEASVLIAKSAGIEPEQYWRSIQPLVKGTLQSITDRGSQDTLSGPISRGDVETVDRHLRALEGVPANISELYANLGKHVLSRAVKHSSLERDSIIEIHKLLDAATNKSD